MYGRGDAVGFLCPRCGTPYAHIMAWKKDGLYLVGMRLHCASCEHLWEEPL